MALIGEGDALVTAVGTGRAALEAIGAQRFDCLIIDLGLPDMSGVELIEQIRRSDALTHLPIVVYTAQTLEPAEAERLAHLADTTVTKGVDAPERLRDETSRFLHRVIDALPGDRRRALVRFRPDDVALHARKVLIIDDDVRNIFSLTSALERYGIETCYAETGADGLRRLRDEADVDVVLVDIMMPEMDGYETIGAIRALKAFRDLPLIAVTAKAMKGDREKCLAAGASDYIAKPVDIAHLVGLIAARLGEESDGRPSAGAATSVVEHAGE
jgi:CheY-like chemotaxis protein